MLALVGHWWVAAILILVERVGKAIRAPARDAMLSHAGNHVGMGWAFGLHEALDQIGGMVGPLLIAIALYFKEGYQFSFAILLIPALLALITLLFARWLYPRPQDLEIEQSHLQTSTMSAAFWLYLTGAALIAAGYADFPLMAYHFQKTGLLSLIWIPIAYSIAMGANTMSAPLLGHLYDRKGFSVLIVISLISCLFAPFVFLGNFSLALLGVILWSIGVGAHESLMRAIVAKMIPKEQRASAYGIFNTGFGVFWFLGSASMGMLYDISVLALVIFSVMIQLLAIPLLLMVKNKYF